jgi:hypothetical protein
MAQYALVLNGKVENFVVADSEAALGEMAFIYEHIVDVTSNEPQPGRGWSYDGTMFYPPKIDDVAKALWTGTGFDTVEDAEAAAAAEEEKVKAVTSVKKKGDDE